MWKPLSIVSGVALLAAGGISYVMVRPAYIAEHKQAANADKYLTDSNKLQTTVQAEEKKAEEKLKIVQTGLTKAQSEKAAATAEKEEVLKLLEKQNADKAAAEQDLTTTKSKIQDFGNVQTMTAELQKLQGESVKYDSQIASAKSAIASALARKSETDRLITSVKRIDLWQRSGSMPDSFSSRVTSVNAEWGFVTIAAGNGSSVVKQAKLDVLRGGSLIGRVIVTHVNPNSSVAEIVPGTINPGDSILPGDRVVVNVASRGSHQQVPAPAASKPSAPAKNTTDPAVPAPPVAPAADPFAPPADTAPPAETTPAPEAPPAETTPAPETPPAETAPEAPPAETPAPVEPAPTETPAPGN